LPFDSSRQISRVQTDNNSNAAVNFAYYIEQLVLHFYVLLLLWLASFEGKYKDHFNKSVYTDDNQALIGNVARDRTIQRIW